MQIRPFALERYFGEHEFSAPYLLCASDVEPYTLAEALALADDETRALWDALSLGYTETAGLPAAARGDRRALPGASRPRTCSSSSEPRRGSSPSPTRR